MSASQVENDENPPGFSDAKNDKIENFPTQ